MRYHKTLFFAKYLVARWDFCQKISAIQMGVRPEFGLTIKESITAWEMAYND